METRNRPPGTLQPNPAIGRFLRPAYLLPAAVVAGAFLLALAVQPSPRHSTADDTPRVASVPSSPTVAAPSPTSSPSPVPHSPSPSPSPPAAPEEAVAGARSTPSATPTVDPALLEQPTRCGTLRETAVALSVEQAISGISVRATRAAVYPIEYFSCILVAAGGSESLQLASAIRKQETAGMTHVVLIDLWVANGSKLFGQLNFRTATIAAAGQTFAAIATLGSRSELVIASGQGRNVTLVAAVRNTIGESVGPVTLVIDAPLAAGTPIAGRYQLFLPTP
ncbi:hypothetical protein [Tepidiforma thermophila]|uniref:Uncharacterized protein n=1 Tax=Tepidiforma thermophila (strain KCTC 52669 / CGMCC 1.13589 / G233) TaxID=2761530 RepID=A0A2A9HG94_TEPT2|nr:hypothetical protein [Tepidiforma thermophila]PFG73996.1 hypothetical protein A9A59_1203 [Tepidiforma thermophila]